VTIMVRERGSSSLEAKHSAQMYPACSFRNVITASWSFKSATPADRLLIQCQARKNCRRTIFHEIREPDRIGIAGKPSEAAGHAFMDLVSFGFWELLFAIDPHSNKGLSPRYQQYHFMAVSYDTSGAAIGIFPRTGARCRPVARTHRANREGWQVFCPRRCLRCGVFDRLMLAVAR
jgi:hypothetical protein